MIEELFIGLATAGLTRMGKQIETAVSRRKPDKIAQEEVHAARILSAFDFQNSLLRGKVTVPKDVDETALAAILSSPWAEATAFELVAVMLSGSEAAAMQRVRDSWLSAFVGSMPTHEALGTQLFGILRDHYEIVTDMISDQCPEAYPRLREEAHHKRIGCVLEAIERRLDPTRRQAPSKTTLSDFRTTYLRLLRNAHKNITPPDFESRRDVPIEDLYVSPTITQSIGTEDPEPVGDLLREIDRSVLLGDPGNGKSTASQVMLYRAAKRPNGPIPFLVILREFAPESSDVSVLQHVEKRLETYYQCECPPGAIEHLLETGQALIVFDGLDELLDTTLRRTVTEIVDNFCNRYPLARVLVTSRRVGYEQAPMDPRQFRTYQLNGFDRSQVEDYVNKWFCQEDMPDGQAAKWTHAFMRESEGVADLTSTPLLLALMCIIYRGERSIPRNRPAVYERCATMLFDKWDRHRGLTPDLKVGQLIDPAMKHLAYWLFTAGDSDGVTEQSLISETASYLHERSFEDRDEAAQAAREFVEFCRGRAWVFTDVGTTRDGERLYKFTHRTFLEYFAAYHLSRLTDSPEDLAKTILPRIAKAEWDVVAQLAVQITDKHSDKGANRVFERVLNDGRRRSFVGRTNILAFLTRCLSFVQLSPAVLRQLTREILTRALHEHPKAQSFAAAELVGQLLTQSQHVDMALVQDEVLAILDEEIATGDDERIFMALSLISSRRYLFSLRFRPRARLGSERAWLDLLEEQASDRRELFLDKLPGHPELVRECWLSGWIDLQDVLKTFDRGLDPVFVSPTMPIGLVRYANLAHDLVRSAIYPRDEDNRAFWERMQQGLSDIGTYLNALGDEALPWVDERIGCEVFIPGRDPEDPLPPPLDGDALTGFAALLACGAEESPETVREWSERPLVETLAPAWALLAARFPNIKFQFSGSDREPTADAAWRVLENWSRSELNLSGRRPGSSFGFGRL